MTHRSFTLLVTDTVWERYGSDITAAAPGVDPIVLGPGDLISDDDLARIEVAFFSADCYPTRAGAFIGACLRAPNLRWFHTFSAGTDSPVFGRFLDNGVRLTNSSGSSAQPIAQTVVMFLLALSRDLPAWTRAQAEHRWETRPHIELAGSVLGVVGLGPIGLEVVRLGQALGMHVIGCRRTPQGDEGCEVWTLDRLGDLAAAADWLVLALPLTPDTREIVRAEVLGRMKPTAHIVNVGRGELIDEPALIDALANGRLAGAGLDVFAVEPLPADSPLWDLPNVIITPHSSGNTAGSHHRSTLRFLENLSAYAVDGPLSNEILRAGDQA